MKNLFLIEIEKLLQLNRRLLKKFKSGLQPNTIEMSTFMNNLIVDELNYDRVELAKTHDDLLLM